MRGTIFAPYGRDADIAGAVYALAVENRGGETRRSTSALEGTLGHRQLRVRTPRAFEDAHRVVRRGESSVVVLEGSALPGLVALAHRGRRRRDARRRCRTASDRYAVRRQVARRRRAGTRADRVLPRRRPRARRRRGDGRGHAAARLARRCSPPRATRCGRSSRPPGNEGVDRLINRNLLFAYFYGVGRALDDAHYYLVRTRAPWHARGVTVRDWEALMWTMPAVQLADPPLARELLLRACELHGYAPGRGVHYFDGTLFEPGFSLEGAAAYAIADRPLHPRHGRRPDRRGAGVADTLYLVADDIGARRDGDVPLYSTEVTPSGAAGGAPVHAARQRGRRAGARRLPPHARRGDGARGRGSRGGARGDRAATSSPEREGKAHVRGRRSISRARRSPTTIRRLGALAAAVRGGRAQRLDLSAHGERRSTSTPKCSRSSARGCWGRTRRRCCSGSAARRSTAASRRKSSMRRAGDGRTAATRRSRGCWRNRRGTRCTRSG